MNDIQSPQSQTDEDRRTELEAARHKNEEFLQGVRETPKPKISIVTGGFMIFVALLFDATDWILGALSLPFPPLAILFWALGEIVDIAASFTFGFWLWFLGASPVQTLTEKEEKTVSIASKMLSYLGIGAVFAIEFSPLGFLPTWTAYIVGIIIKEWMVYAASRVVAGAARIVPRQMMQRVLEEKPAQT